MLNVQDDLPHGSDDTDGPSRPQVSTSSQNLQTKEGNNGEESKKGKPSTPQSKHCNQNNPTEDMQSVNTLLNGLDLNSTVDSNSSPKRKRQKKRPRKNLHVHTDVNIIPETSRSANIPIVQQNGTTNPLHNILTNLNAMQVSPSSTVFSGGSPRYLNNLSHHPQFQYMQQMQNAIEIQQTLNALAMLNSQQHAVSAPNTPQAGHAGLRSSTSIPCSPLNSQVNNHFFQNMMQHPLLSQNFMTQNVACNANAASNVNTTRNTNAVRNGNTARNAHSARNANTANNANAVNNANAASNANAANNANAASNANAVSNTNAATPNGKSKQVKKFEQYISSEEAEKGIRNGSLLEGVLRINPKQFQQGFISTSDRDEQDIFIDGIENRNRALEGDVVVVQLVENPTTENSGEENSEKKQKRGKVVFIKEKVHSRLVIGNLKLMSDKNRQKALFTPRDHRVPRLNIPFSCWPDNFYKDAKKYEDTLFLAKIVDWFDTRFAVGKLLSNIGQAGDMEAESKAILAQNDLDVSPFGPEVRHLFPRFDYVIPEEEVKLREDCRKECIFSIDPSNCRDIDDAISCRELENGNYEIGVHISDVAHYLTENTDLDEKVSQKATTIYLVEKAYHMLPDELCMLCSLFPGVDKLAFSVFWEITKEAQVLRHRFSKTIINSCAQLAYDHAQAILEGRDDAADDFPETYNGFGFQDIKKTIKIVGDLAAKFRQRRFEGGALRIDQPKVSFRLSPKNGLPESYWIYEIKESNQMIEEFMLLANMTVAQRIYEDHPDLAFLRCHPPPSGHMMRNLAKALKPLGIDLDISSAGELHKSLLAYTGPDCLDVGRAMVLNMLCAKPMTRAKYFCAAACEDDDFHHYALNVPLYTHFTSPIRRYADIMVHRLLAASLRYRSTPSWEVDKVRAVAAQCNKQKYNAKRAGEMSSELYMLKYIEMHSPVLTEAVVVEVRERYIDVIIAAMGLNRRIFFNNDFPGEFNCIKHEGGNKMSKMEVVWRAEEGKPEVKQTIETFSVLKVLLIKGEDSMLKVETKLMRPEN